MELLAALKTGALDVKALSDSEETALGIPICKKIMEAHNGSLSIKSKTNENHCRNHASRLKPLARP